MGEDGSVVGHRGENVDDTGLEAWEHLPGEDPVDYHVFELYVQLGYARTVRAAAEEYFAEIKQPCPTGYRSRFTVIATEWRWQERADAYWRIERRRNERLLQERRDAFYELAAGLCERTLEKLRRDHEKAFGKASGRYELTANGVANTVSKLLESWQTATGDSDEDRKRRGRPPEEVGDLPAVEDRLKPPEET